MKRFFKYAKKKTSGLGDRRSLGSVGSLASSSVASSSDHGSVYSLAGEHLGYAIDLKRTDKLFTKLHKACWSNNLEKVKKHYKNDVNARDSEKRTPLHLACARGSKDIILFLLSVRADINACDSDDCTPLHKSIQCHHPSIVQLLVDRGADLKLRDVNGSTVLHLATKENNIEMISIILDKGGNVDNINGDGKTALHIATESSNVKIVEMFLLHGASVNVQDNLNKTCLMIAAEIGSEEIIALLLEYGANVTLVDSKGWTCETYADASNHENCLKLFKENAPKNTFATLQDNILPLGPIKDTNSEITDPTQQIANHGSDKEDSLVGSFADSWSNSSEDDPKKGVLKDLNLQKFLSSVDISDAELSDKENESNPQKVITGPPKPPRSFNINSPSHSNEVLDISNSSEVHNAEDKSKEITEVAERLAADDNERSHVVPSDSSDISTINLLKNENDTAALNYDKTKSHNVENNADSTDIEGHKKEKELGSGDAKVINKSFSEVSITNHQDEVSAEETKAKELTRSQFGDTNAPVIRISTADEEAVNEVDTSLAIKAVNGKENKPHLFQKKSDATTSRHERTPSGNFIKDVHPLAHITNPLTDSEDSDWDSDNNLSLLDISERSKRSLLIANDNHPPKSDDLSDRSEIIAAPEEEGRRDKLRSENNGAELPSLFTFDKSKLHTESPSESSDLKEEEALVMKDSLEEDRNLLGRHSTIEDDLHAVKDSTKENQPSSVKDALNEESNLSGMDIKVENWSVPVKETFSEEESLSKKDILTEEQNHLVKMKEEDVLSIKEEESFSIHDISKEEEVSSAKDILKEEDLRSAKEILEEKSLSNNTVVSKENILVNRTNFIDSTESVDEAKSNMIEENHNDVKEMSKQDLITEAKGHHKILQKNIFNDGTLGRDDTLLGTEEIWERNASLDVDDVGDNDESSSESKITNTSDVENVFSHGLKRQNAIEEEHCEDHLDAITENKRVEPPQEDPLRLDDDDADKRASQTMAAQKIDNSSPRTVTQIRQHFEGLINDMQLPEEKSPVESSSLRRGSLNTEFLGKAFKKHSAPEGNLKANGEAKIEFGLKDFENSRRHSVATPFPLQASSLSKQLEKLQYDISSRNSQTSISLPVSIEESPKVLPNSDKNETSTNTDTIAPKPVRKFGFFGKPRLVDSQKTLERCNSVSEDMDALKKQEHLTMTLRDTNNTKNKPTLFTSLEKFPGVKKLTQRFSFSSDPRSKHRKTSSTKRNSISADEKNVGDVTPPLTNNSENEEHEDFVQEVLERLDIRRRSSIGIMNSVVECHKTKKLSHSSSLEILTESNSSLSSCSESDVFKTVLKKKPRQVLELKKSASMEGKEMPSEDDDDENDDDDEDDEKCISMLKNDPLTPSISKMKAQDPQSYIHLQSALQELCISLKKEKGEKELIEERLKSIISERDCLQEHLDDLQDKYCDLQEQSLDLQSQLNMSHWELHFSKEQWKMCEANMKKLMENLKKKEEILYEESNLRQQSELSQISLQNELTTISENLTTLYNECQFLQSKVSSQSVKECPPELVDCAVSTEMIVKECDSSDKEIKDLEQKLFELQELYENALDKNRNLEDSLEQCRQDYISSKRELENLKMRAQADSNEWKQRLDASQQELKFGEEALNQATLKYLKQIELLESENKLLSEQAEKERNDISCLKNQNASLENELATTKLFLQRKSLDCESEFRTLIQAKEELERKLLYREEELKNISQKKEEVANYLCNSNKKIDELEALLRSKETENSGVGLINEQMLQLQSELLSIKNHLANSHVQTQPLKSSADVSPVVFQSTQTSRPSSPVSQNFIITPVCDKCAHTSYQQPKPTCIDRSLQTDQSEDKQATLTSTEKELFEMKQQIEAEKNEMCEKTIKIQMLEKEIFNLTEKFQEKVSKLESEKAEFYNTVCELRQQLQLTKAKLSNTDTDLYQAQMELAAMKKKATTLENTLVSSQELAKKWENDCTELSSKWKDAHRELDASIKRENKAMSSLTEMEQLFQNAKKQIHELQLKYDCSQQNMNDLESQLFEVKTELDKTTKTLHNIESDNIVVHQQLQDKEKAQSDLQTTVAHLRCENAQLSQRLLMDVRLQQQKWESEARDRTDLAVKLIELEEKQQQSVGLLNKQQENSSTLLSHNDALHKIIEQEKKKNILLQEQILKFESYVPATKVPSSLGLNLSTAENVSIPTEILDQIKDLKKQAEELKLRVKQEKAHRQQCETQLNKARKELAEVPKLRKSISYLEDVRKDLRDHLTNLQKHVKNHCVDRDEVDKMRQYYEAMSCQTLQSKLGQVHAYLDEQNKVKDHLDQVRLNNETQMKIDLQKTMNELFEEVTELRVSLHQSKSQVESLQNQCDRLQELYNNEVQLRSKLSEDLSKVQIRGTDQFSLTRKNILKKHKENAKDLKSFDLAKFQVSHQMPKNYLTSSEDSILYKLKSELNKGIQHHLSDDFPNLNVIPGNTDFVSTKQINTNFI